MIQQQEPNRITVKSFTNTIYTIRIARPISEPDTFHEELLAIDGATENDTIVLELVTEGGLLSTAALICRSLERTPAHKVAYIGTHVASAGTQIALACDEWEIDEMSSFMIHAPTTGLVGKHNEIFTSAKHQEKMLERWVRNVYTGFLSEEEIQAVIDGKDFWFEGQELADRLEAYAKWRSGGEEELDMPVAGE